MANIDAQHVARNQERWHEWAKDYAEWAPAAWATSEITWGIFQVPDDELGALPRSVAGLDVAELGCGTAYFSAWLARRGARPVALDASPAQLQTARLMQERTGIVFPLEIGNAEKTPFAPATFDLVVSEYGASIWCDPYLWIPEASRILRPGGQLIFLTNGVLLSICTPPSAGPEDPVTHRLERDYFGLHRLDWNDGSTTFNLGYGDWIRILHASGFEIDDLIEIKAPPDTVAKFPIVTTDWATRWPSEEIWKARKKSST